MIDVNVGAALWLTQAVVPYLRDRGSGSIVHVAARPGLEPAGISEASPRPASPGPHAPDGRSASARRAARCNPLAARRHRLEVYKLTVLK